LIINEYDAEHLHRAFGIDMSTMELGPLDDAGIGGGWGRVVPGGHSDAHQHDEIETFVIVAGRGELVVDSGRRPVAAGTVIQFAPFETHHLENTGEQDLLFATFYWRDPDRAARAAAAVPRRRFDERPVFVFSSPTTPNGDLHVGHLSGPYLGADVFTRFQRMNGTRVWHIAGSDDFQSYVPSAARAEGRGPAETAAHYSAEILATHLLMDIGVDQYTVSNADPGYREGVQRFFARVAASDLVEPRAAEALFDAETGRYLYEPDVSGKCPTCGSGTGGNMCEECGEPNFCADLVEPKSGLSAAQPRVDELTRYMLALHELMPAVDAHHRLGRVPARVRELAGRLAQRERLDVAITHPGEWGVPPQESLLPGQNIWVWIDMAYRFLYGIEAIGRRQGEQWDAQSPQGEWKIVHFLGYDNSFYHAIFCPALYKLAHPDWTPDIDYHVNEFYELDSDKFSTSRGHAVWGKDILGPESVDAVRFHLSRTRPEGRRTNFTMKEYEATLHDTLIGTWQRWLDDLGTRVATEYGGEVPDAGIWTPEHTGFLARLGTRLAELTNALAEDGFSLNRAAAALNGIVEDVVAFRRDESRTAGSPGWRDESRTAIALELAAAKLLAVGAAPVMPRFAGRLAAALRQPEPSQWPRLVTLVAPGTRIGLAGQVYFGPGAQASAEAVVGVGAAVAQAVDSDGSLPHSEPQNSELLPWLDELVRAALQLSAERSVGGQTLVNLGMESMQAIALQYQIMEKLDLDVPVDVLLGERTVAQLAEHLGGGAAPAEVPGT
jgi:methionyl-tRNA synthetase